MSTVISFAQIGKGDLDLVRHVQILPDQTQFSGTPEDILSDADPDVDFHVIKSGDAVVGLFKIDRRMDRNPFAHPGELGLRGVLVGAQFQGRGLGKAAFRALPAYLRDRYDAPSAVLSVNCRNRAAHHVYCQAGWQDEGELYHGGPAGPQHVLRLPL